MGWDLQIHPTGIGIENSLAEHEMKLIPVLSGRLKKPSHQSHIDGTSIVCSGNSFRLITLCSIPDE